MCRNILLIVSNYPSLLATNQRPTHFNDRLFTAPCSPSIPPPMKEISEVEEKPFTSSLNICPEDCYRKGWEWVTSKARPPHKRMDRIALHPPPPLAIKLFPS
jgi:hypothetical protein